MLSLGSCSGFLDTKPDTLLTQDQTFGDPTLVKSVLANFYGRVTIGQRIDDWDQWTMLDEVIHFDTNSDENIDRNKWRTYDYTLVHDLKYVPYKNKAMHEYSVLHLYKQFSWLHLQRLRV